MKKYHWSVISTFLMLSLAFLKLGVGFLSNSIALKAEGIHSLSDSVASLIAFVSIYISEKKHEKFPYGLYKLENIGAMFISFFLFFAAYDMGMDVLFGHYKIEKQYVYWGLAVGLISMLVSVGYSIVERMAAKKHNSPALMADSEHLLIDGLGSFVIVLNFLSLAFSINLDKFFASIIIALMIYTGFHILKEQVLVMLDASVDSKMIDHIKSIILQDPRVISVKRLLVRKSGDKIFIDAAISIKAHDFNKSHAIVDDIEDAISRTFPQTDMVFIHYEPDDSPENTRIAVLTCKDAISDFKNADMIHIYVDFILNSVLKAKDLDIPEKKEEITASDITQVKPDFIISSNHPKSNKAKWIIHKYGIFIWETDQKDIQKALDEIKVFIET